MTAILLPDLFDDRLPLATVPSDRDPLWRLSVTQYHAMLHAGILTADDPVELLAGWLVRKMPKNPAHRAATRLLSQALERLLPAGWYVDTQEPITLADSEPEPDVVIVRGDTRQYLDRHPGSQDVTLVVEIADTTLQRDRVLKQRLYAQAGIPVYWIVNLPERQVEVYSQPSRVTGMAYGQRQDYPIIDSVPVVVAEQRIGFVAVQDLI
jgi:Uma2 family endonuclease